MRSRPKLTPRVLNIIRERSGDLCEVCGKQAGQTHHRRPKGMGGSKDPATNCPSNLLRLCGGANVTGNCHSWIESNRHRAFEEGLLVPQFRDPLTVRVKLRHGWVFLTDDGRYIDGEAADAS